MIKILRYRQLVIFEDIFTMYRSQEFLIFTTSNHSYYASTSSEAIHDNLYSMKSLSSNLSTAFLFCHLKFWFLCRLCPSSAAAMTHMTGRYALCVRFCTFVRECTYIHDKVYLYYSYIIILI